MRKIKFRGFTTNYTDNEWVYGDLIHYDTGEIYIMPQNDRYWDIPNDGERVVKDSIGQFTGLKDKNGKESYEGDILEFETGEIFKVYWWESECCCYIQSILEPYINISFEMYPMENFEIIGNIFENKELLENERYSKV